MSKSRPDSTHRFPLRPRRLNSHVIVENPQAVIFTHWAHNVTQGSMPHLLLLILLDFMRVTSDSGRTVSSPVEQAKR